jgi:tellurite resistance protein TerC
MTHHVLFPFAEYWWFYLLFTLFVLGMLALDLGVFHRQAHAVSIKEASIWSVVWVVLAMIFCGVLYQYALWRLPLVERLASLPGFDAPLAAKETALEYLTGYIVEKSLAVDNIFVFVVIFTYFAIPPQYQHRILFFGILGALGFRILFIALGSVLMQYHWIVILFGVFLIATGIKILFAPEKPLDPGSNPILKILRRLVPVSTTIDGQRFFTRIDGIRHATPLFVALVFIECCDIIFAVDSVPAIFAITNEPLIVYTSNVFAILGLRAMYFLLAGVVGKFRFLKYGLGLVLVFVGLKMVWLNEAFGGKFPITWSLGIITLVIGASIALSWLIPDKSAARSKSP